MARAVDLHLALHDREGLAEQVYARVRSAVRDGRLRPGDLLPSTRELATRAGIARNTVAMAYDRLVAEGYLTARPGSGTFVTEAAAVTAPEPAARTTPLRPRPVWEDVPDLPDMSAYRFPYDFRAGLPDASRFPFATWRGLLARALRAGTAGAGAYADPAGDPGLREVLARHLGVSRGIVASAADVTVTNGVQQACDLVARTLVGPGDVVAVENPGYPPPARLFATLGAKVVGVPVDAEGLVVDALPERVRLVYVSPAHQFPMGMPMSLPRRRALLAWAGRTGAAILEDDYDSDFRYAGRPVEPLHGLDDDGRVVYVGSFSKVLLPTLRLGFVVAPPGLHDALRRAKQVTDWHTALPLQLALAAFVRDGGLARHVRRMRRAYSDRQHRLTEGLHTILGDHLRPIPTAAGLHVSALFEPPRDDIAAAATAAAGGVGVEALSSFAVTEPVGGAAGAAGAAVRPGLLFGFGAMPAERIEAGLTRLRDLLEA